MSVFIGCQSLLREHTKATEDRLPCLSSAKQTSKATRFELHLHFKGFSRIHTVCHPVFNKHMEQLAQFKALK